MKVLKRRKKSIILRLALLAFAVYVIVMLVQSQMMIAQSQSQSRALDAKIEAQQLVIQDLHDKGENYTKYLDQQAREHGWARPGETVVGVVPGE